MLINNLIVSFLFGTVVLVFSLGVIYFPVVKTLRGKPLARLSLILIVGSLFCGYIYQIYFAGASVAEGPTFNFFDSWFFLILFVLLVCSLLLISRKRQWSERCELWFNSIPSMGSQKRRWILVLFMILGLIGGFFLLHGLVSSSPILLDDYTINYFQTLVFQHSFPYFRSIFFPNPYFLNGFLDRMSYNPGMMLIALLISPLQLSDAILQRIFLIFTFIAYLWTLPTLVQRAGITKNKSPSVILYLFSVIFWYKLLTNGQMNYLLAGAFALFGIIGLLSLFQVPSNQLSSQRMKWIGNGILWGIAFLFHFMTALALGLALLVSLGLKLERKSIPRQLREFLRPIAYLILGLLIPTAFWILPLLYYQRYLSTNFLRLLFYVDSGSSSYIQQEATFMFTEYFHSNLILSGHGLAFIFWPVLVIGGINCLRKSQTLEKYIVILDVGIFGVGVSLNLLFPSLSPIRMLLFCEFLNVVPFTRGLLTFRGYFQQQHNPIPWVTLITLYLTFSGFGIHARFYNTHYTYISPTPQFDSMNTWLDAHVSETSRVLFEDLNYSSDLQSEFENQAALLAARTHIRFVGSYNILGFAPPDLFAFAMNGYAFNYDLQTVNISVFQDLLTFFNVEYIVGYSDPLRNLMVQNALLFESTANFSSYGIYRVKNFQNNAFLISPSVGSSWSLIHQQPDVYEYLLVNCSAGENLTMSFFDFPNWHVYLDGQAIPKYPDSLFIHFQIPLEGNHTLQVRWEKPLIEHVGVGLSIGLIMVATTVIIIELKTRITRRKKGSFSQA